MADSVDSKLKLISLGPGSYELNVKSKGPKYSMGKMYPLPQKQKTPGAGEYTIPSKIVESPGKTMGEKRDLNFNSIVPGPGSYDADLIKKSNYHYS